VCVLYLSDKNCKIWHNYSFFLWVKPHISIKENLMSDKISVTGSHVYREAKSNIFIIRILILRKKV
jgi:hypothetical protein